MRYEDVLSRFGGSHDQAGDGCLVECPSHEDDKDSLSITEKDGKILLYCHAGCDTESVLQAVGLKFSDLFINNGNQDRYYNYVDEDGWPLYRVHRTATKTFSQQRLNNGSYVPGLKDTRRVLYNLPEVLKAETVFVVEGEKDVETLREHGIVATTNSGGANGWRDEFGEVFRGKTVIVIPDNDEPGLKHGLRVVRSALPFAKEVKLIELPGVPEKGDVTDFLSDRTKEELLQLVTEAKPVSAWPEPEELPGELPLVPVIVPAMIPEPFRPWLTDISDRMQCPLDFPAIGAIVAVASLIGRKLGIRPKQKDDWTVIPNLWGGVVGRPGIMKTPALDEAKKPLQRLEMEALADNEKRKQDHEVKLMISKAKKEELQRQIREAVASGEPTDGFKLPQEEELVLRRYMVNDSTVEKLGELLNQNPDGLLLFRDELVGWLRTLDREGHENDRAFYLEAWNGNGSYTYDRIGRGTLNIKAACVSILGGIQPGPLNDYLISTLKGGAGADGLLQRFQLLVYPDDPGQWKNTDRQADVTAKNNAFRVFEMLSGDMSVLSVDRDRVSFGSPFRVVSIGEETVIPSLKFTPEAQELFNEWRFELENKIRAGDEHPAIEAHLSKYRSLMPSLALIFHVISTLPEIKAEVSIGAVKMSAAWCDYLESHARRVYNGLVQGDISTARRIGQKLSMGKLPDPFTARDIYRKGWTGLSDLKSINLGLSVLCEIDWVRMETVKSSITGGRPTSRYWINPRVKRA